MKKVLDTNVLLDYPQIVTKDTEDWIIPLVVLKEIDGLKMAANPETARKARKAAVFIAKNMDNIKWDFTTKKDLSVDSILLEIVKENENYILVTNDVSLKVIAKAKSIPVEGYSWKDDYIGVRYVDISNMTVDEYNTILHELINSGDYTEENYEFSVNEYLIVPPYCTEDKSKSSIFKYTGEFFEQVSIRQVISNTWIDKIRPRNDEQICLFDLLNSNVPVVYAGGKFGCGKSFLTYNYAIGELQDERITKIVYVPNNAYAQDTMEVGTLPGELLPKLMGSLGPLIDLVGIDQITRWMEEEKLEIVPLAYMRGRSFKDSIILVSEAENLTESHVKLLVSRCGENTRIFFDGDIDQADSAIFKDRNGLKLLLNLHKSEHSDMFGTVFLNKIERSKTAELADTLDQY